MPPLYFAEQPVDRFLRYLKSKKPYDIDLVKSYMEIQYPNGFYDFSEENDNYLNLVKYFEKNNIEYEIKIKPLKTSKPMLGMIKIETDSKLKKHSRKLAFFSIARKRR